MLADSVSVSIADPINAQILSVSEDKIQGFHADPFGEIARLSGVDVDTVLERIRAMLQAGTIRRVRQTLMSVNLAPGRWSPGRCLKTSCKARSTGCSRTTRSAGTS